MALVEVEPQCPQAGPAERWTAGRIWQESLAVTLVTLGVICSIFLWIDNVHLGTMNGLWKSVLVNEWKHSPATARLDPSNYFYFPLEGLFCRGLEFIGVYSGRTWKQLAVVSCVFGALSTGIVFWFTRKLTNSFGAALAAAVLHTGAGFVLQLSISNEDIMPGYFFVLLAMLMAVRWFAKPTMFQVVVVGAVFSVSWLIEWRLMFPTLPAFVLGLAISDASVKRRMGTIGTLVATIVASAILAATLFSGHNGAVGTPALLWTGKGVDSGYAGFSNDKWVLLAVGMGEYLLGGAQLSSSDGIQRAAYQWGTGLLVEGAVIVVAAFSLWHRRNRSECRAAAAVLLGTLAAGEVFNLYSQPQDPQMQINVMVWLAVTWGMVWAQLLPRNTRIGWSMVVALSTIPLIYNTHQFGLTRGADSRQLAELEKLESTLDLSRTVFFYFGWENIVAWQYTTWTQRWEGVCDLPASPVPVPKFKWISVVGGAVNQPQWTGTQHAASLRKELDCAFDRGFTVVAAGIWKISAEQLSGELMSLNARDHGPPIHALFNNEQYSAQAILELPRYFRIERK